MWQYLATVRRFVEHSRTNGVFGADLRTHVKNFESNFTQYEHTAAHGAILTTHHDGFRRQSIRAFRFESSVAQRTVRFSLNNIPNVLRTTGCDQRSFRPVVQSARFVRTGFFSTEKKNTVPEVFAQSNEPGSAITEHGPTITNDRSNQKPVAPFCNTPNQTDRTNAMNSDAMWVVKKGDDN